MSYREPVGCTTQGCFADNLCQSCKAKLHGFFEPKQKKTEEPIDWSLVATPESILAAEDGGGAYSPPDWADLRKSFVSMMAKIDLRFRSGNSIKADRAHITAEEWALMGRYEEACEDLITTVLSNAPSQAGVREVSEEDIIALVPDASNYHHKMDHAQDAAAKSRDHCREQMMQNVKIYFETRRAMANGVAQGDSHGR